MVSFPPGLLMIIGGMVCSLLPYRLRSVSFIAIPVISLWHMLALVPSGLVVSWTLFDLDLTLIRADRLSLVWGTVFHIAAILGALYGVHQRGRLEPGMSLVYAGAAIASVFAGDLLTLFLFWELTAISSVFLVWAGRTRNAYAAGMRYLVIQVTSGVLLLAGAIFQWVDHGSLAFGQLGEVGAFRDQVGGLAAGLILVAFGIKAAFPLMHMWLPDAYPEATPAGTVFLSAFTTKLAVYALLRGFAGYDPLIVVGCIMAVVPLIYALVEDDVRRSLAYCLNNQLGFMIVAVGVGSELAVNGATAHAVAHILYKGLLFMAAGAVLLRTGTAKASKLGGLAAVMPLTFIGYLVGVAAISAPLFCGFVTKSLTLSAVAEAHHQVAWIALLAATAGVFLVCGVRITSDVFLGRQRTTPIRPLPWNMAAAMIASSTCCVLIGVAPSALYRHLPFPVDYHAYTVPHVVEQLQLMAFAGVAYVLLVALGLFPFSRAGHLWDADWLYRRGVPRVMRFGNPYAQGWAVRFERGKQAVASASWDWLSNQMADDGRRGRFVSTGRMAMAMTVMLVIYLLLYYR